MLDVSGHKVSIAILTSFHRHRVECRILRVGQTFRGSRRIEKHAASIESIKQYPDILLLERELFSVKHFGVFRQDRAAQDRNETSDERLFQDRPWDEIIGRRVSAAMYRTGACA